MGQAKQRGSFTQRQQMALERNKKLHEEICKTFEGEGEIFYKGRTTQQVATAMTAQGLLPVPLRK